MAVGRYGSVAVLAFGVVFGAGVRSASANMCDLTTLNSSCGPGFAGGAIFRQASPQPTGTGYVDSFVRIQHTGTEQGYNTDARPLQFDEKTDATFTHSLKISGVSVVNINGTNYRQFFLDINENNSGNGHNLSLDKLQIFLGSTGNISGYSGGLLNGMAPIYDLDTGTDNWIKLNYSLNSGSGSGDMVAYIPDSLFASAATNPYVYLYSQFGATVSVPGKLTSDAGFEEWWAVSPLAVAVTPVPEPTGLLLLGSGLVVAGRRLRNRRRQARAALAGDQTTKVVPNADLSPAV